MNRSIHTLAAIGIISLLLGCNGEKQQNREPVWEDVKLGDLAPAGQRPEIKRLDSINFQVHVFEVPAENTGKLDDISKILYAQPFRFKHFKAFVANSFSVSFGRTSSGNQIFDMLSEAGARRVGSTVMLLSDGQFDDLPITRLFDQTSIYYTSTDGSIKTETIGPGPLALRMKVQIIPASRGVCNVTFTPACPSPLKQLMTKSSERPASNDTLFESCGFSLKMSPGDFIFLRPVQYISHQNSLGSLFFSRAAAKPYVISFLIICTQISD